MKNQKGFAPIIILVILGLIGAIGYLGYQNFQLGSQNQSVTTPTPLLSPTSDPTANWKKFRGEVFRYRYPANFYRGPHGGGNDNSALWATEQESKECHFGFPAPPQPNCNGPLIEILVMPVVSSQEYLSLQEQLDKYPGAPTNYTNPQGVEMLKVEGTKMAAFISNKTGLYRVSLQIGDKYWSKFYPNSAKSNEEKYQIQLALFNGLLSTFEFLEPLSGEIEELSRCMPTTDSGATKCYSQKTKEDCLKMASECRWVTAVR